MQMEGMTRRLGVVGTGMTALSVFFRSTRPERTGTEG